jgi:serine/threonine-protein kinase
MLTGRPVFDTKSPIAMLLAHMRNEPPRPSELAPHPIPTEFEDLIADCLGKLPDDRPADAGVVRRRQHAIGFENPWTSDRIEAWWAEHQPPDAASDGPF